MRFTAIHALCLSTALVAVSHANTVRAQTAPQAAPGAANSDAAQIDAIDPRMRINPLAFARTLIDRGRADLACALLRSTHGVETTDVRALALLGECSQAIGDRPAAIDFTRRALERQPNSLPLRTRLGSLYLAAGDTNMARRVFAGAEATNPAADGSRLLSEVARQLPVGDPRVALRDGPKRTVVELFTGLVYDSNINGGPSSSTVAAVIGGVPLTLTLTDDSRPKDAWGSTSSVNVSHLQPLSANYALLYQGSLGATFYFGEGNFNTDSAALGVALIYREQNLTLSVQPNARFIRLDEELDEAAYGISSRGTLKLEGPWSLTGSAGYAHRRIPINSERDSDQGLLSAGFTYAPGINGSELGMEYILERNVANSDVYSDWTHGPLIYLTTPLAEGLQGTLSYRYSHSLYDARQALFAETRSDDEHLIGAGLTWDVSQWTVPGASLRLQYMYVSSDSTVDLYESDRHIMSTGVALRF